MRKSSDIKKLIIFVFFLIILTIIGLIVFISNVNVIMPETSSNEVNEEENEPTTYEQVEVSNIITTLNNTQANFKLYDTDGSFSVELEDNTINFSIVDKEKFERQFPDSKLKSDTGVIATHDYKLKDVFIGTVDGEEYVIVITKDGKIGSMNVKEAVNNNILRIKNELQDLEHKKIAFIQKVIINDGDSDVESALAVATDGTVYDLSAYLTK